MRLLLRLILVAIAATVACGELYGEDEPNEAPGDAGDEDVVEDVAAPAEDASADTETSDAGDAKPGPTDAGPPLVYVVSGRFWTFEPVAMAWAGGTILPTGTCPALDDVAMAEDSALFAIGGTLLFRLTPTPLSCAQIGATPAKLKALTFAPRGTVDAAQAVLVGYRDNGDYLRVDTKSAAVSVITSGALSGFTIGDLTNIGQSGYVSVSGNGCAADCIWRIDLSTGTRVGTSPIATIATAPAKRVAGLAHWGGKLYAFAQLVDQPYVVNVMDGGQAQFGGPPGYTNIGWAGAASNPLAPQK